MNDEALQRVERYLATAGLEGLKAEAAAIQTAVQGFIGALGNLTRRLSDEALYTYQVPMLSDDGACSLIEEMAPTPYDLTGILGGRNEVNRRKLLLLNQAVEHATQLTGADWLGVYQARTNAEGNRVLVKLAYRGRPSRAEFPLNAEFAKGSTNSKVGLSGWALVIDDVTAYTAEGGGFYVCDDAVQSEMCTPIFDEAGKVLGIIDAEAQPKGFFNVDRQALIAALALVVPVLLP
ncbi:MAG: GAF domain-containing protein [Betaproteobacteria bacterium]|nr:GAF domain-containing protein [Betaproteobacteria bacterium]